MSFLLQRRSSCSQTRRIIPRVARRIPEKRRSIKYRRRINRDESTMWSKGKRQCVSAGPGDGGLLRSEKLSRRLSKNTSKTLLTPGNRIPPPTGSKLRYTYGGNFPGEKTEVFSLRLHRQISLVLIDEKPSLDKQNA